MTSCPTGWTLSADGECEDQDECAAGQHSCADASAPFDDDAVSGLTLWSSEMPSRVSSLLVADLGLSDEHEGRYKLEPADPLAESRGGNRLVQTPNTSVAYLYSRLDCPTAAEACAHWSPQPTPPQSTWELDVDTLRWQIPLEGFAPSQSSTIESGITITFCAFCPPTLAGRETLCGADDCIWMH